MKSPNQICHAYGSLCCSHILILSLLFIVNSTYSQIYPEQINVSSVTWESYVFPSTLPTYQSTFVDPITGNNVTRISDEAVFGCDCSKLRHRYAKNQAWNADGTLIMSSGSPSKILDGITYEVLYESYTKALWSNTEPNYTYDTEGNATLVKKNILTNQTTVIRQFSGYTSISIGNNEGNLSNDDRYVALIATMGSNNTIIVYDILNDQIISTRSIGAYNIDWVSVSQSGNYVVVSGYSDGSGNLQGIKVYDKYMNNEIHLYSGRPHGDIGYDTQGNEVYVAYQGINGFALSYARLDNGQKQGLFPFTGATGDRGLWGGHISTRNLNRPGWAYVSDQGHPTDINRFEATREIFAIKLDASQTIERYAKHNSNINISNGYNHQAHAVPNRNGTKVLFASNWDIASLRNNNYPVMFVVEAPQSSLNNQVHISSEIDTICNDSSITLTASGAESYFWTPGNFTTASIQVSPTEHTTFTVTGTHTDGTTSMDTILINVNPIPEANAGEDQSICLGDTITLTASGGASYLWSNGATTQSITINPTATATYSVEVTGNNCSSTDEVIVTVNPLPTVNAGNDVTITPGQSVNLSVSGATTYVWSTGETGAEITVAPTETTTYTVTGNRNGCSAQDEVTVFVAGNIAAQVSEDQTICNGESVTLTASGGDNFIWSNGETTASITVNPNQTTTYSVEVYDNFGNSDTAEVTVLVNAIPEANAGDNQSICLGENITLTASGGTSYLWSNGATTQSITINPTATATYSVEVTENNCSSTDEVTVTVNAIPTVNAGNDVTIAPGQSVNLLASGATTYVWSTGETEAETTVSPIETTTYIVTGTSNGCSAQDEVTVFVVGNIAAQVSEDQTICNGESVTLSASGGDNFLWSNGETTSSITVNPNQTTTYSVEVSDNFGNSDTAEVTITVNPIPEANAGDDQSICLGETITLTASGGASYLWSNGATTQSITINPTSTATYSVEVTENNCSSTDEVTVTVNAIPTVNAGNDVTIAPGQSVNLSASGTTTYVWSTGETEAEITVSPTETTTYIVTGTSNGCSAQDEVTVFVVGNIAAQVSEDQTICNGESVTLSASGGDNFLWSNGETTASITVNPNQTTTYSVEVSDNFGNSDTAEVTITVNPIPNANAGDDQSICLGDTITLTASGGASYLWSNGATTQSITINPTATATYSVEVFENGCSSTDEVIVTVNPIPTVNAGNDVTIAPGQSVNLLASGATTYVWSTGETEAETTVSPIETTTYIVTGTSNGCSAQDEVTVFVVGNIAAQVSEDQTICNGESIILSASGGDNFLWSNGETTTSINVNPNQTTTYSVEVSDNFGNSDTAEVTITVNPIPNANAGDDQSICLGETITLTASGGASYLWSNGATTQSITINPIATATYSVEVLENGCSSTDQVTITVNSVPELQISGETIVVYGNSTTLTVSGADSYVWSNGATSNSITVQPEQTTTYEVIGSINGCSSSQSVMVTVESHVEAFAGEDQRICQGYEVTLTASGGSGYLWNTGATTQSITVSPTSNSTYSVTVFDGPYQDEASVNVFVDPNPNVTIVNGSEATILEGNFITLSATGANSYQWNNGATQPNIAVSPSATTIYRVTGFINDCSDEKEIIVNVLERVVANAGNDVTICPQETATLTATGGDDYLWSTGETTQTIEVAPEETTMYTVTVFNELDFDEATVMVVVDQQCQTVILPDDDEDLTFAFQVYPNPASETLYIQLNGVVNISNLKMFDLAGKLLFSEVLEETNQPYNFEKQIDVTNFQTGLYFVRLEDELRVITKKILIQ